MILKIVNSRLHLSLGSDPIAEEDEQQKGEDEEDEDSELEREEERGSDDKMSLDSAKGKVS